VNMKCEIGKFWLILTLIIAWAGGDEPIIVCSDPFPGIVFHEDKTSQIEERIAAW
jgi:hypothetical protein